MKPHLILIALLSCFWAASPASAQIKVLSAYYGRVAPERSIDVKDVVQAKLNAGVPYFRVTPSSFGANPNPGRRNFLAVTYYSYGQKLAARAEDGDIISFKGGPGVPQPPPAYGGDRRLRFENGYGRVVYLYELDRWGGWAWKAQLDVGAVYSVNGQPGDVWAVSDSKGRILKQVRVPRELGLIRLQ